MNISNIWELSNGYELISMGIAIINLNIMEIAPSISMVSPYFSWKYGETDMMMSTLW